MAIADIGANSALTNNVMTDRPIAIAVLKKSLDIEQQAAVQLINAIPQTGPSVDPTARLGQNIDVTA